MRVPGINLTIDESLEALRERAKEKFPSATWLPGDSCPIGQKVWYNGEVCTVVGEVPTIVESHHCTTCTCTEQSTLAYFWKIEIPNSFRKQDGSYAPDGDGEPFVCIQWPPTLRPYIEGETNDSKG